MQDLLIANKSKGLLFVPMNPCVILPAKLGSCICDNPWYNFSYWFIIEPHWTPFWELQHWLSHWCNRFHSKKRSPNTNKEIQVNSILYTRWACTSYERSYKPYKWPYRWVTNWGHFNLQSRGYYNPTCNWMVGAHHGFPGFLCHGFGRRFVRVQRVSFQVQCCHPTQKMGFLAGGVHPKRWFFPKKSGYEEVTYPPQKHQCSANPPWN